ncbi:MAG: homogentisate 1,2-dioxygenase [Actinomycetales bacterium]|nr:MAG: homogentisate 1,2-dioxygenase [Actinomycetales bacterium]
MPYYRNVGSVPPKRHTQHRTPEGGLYYEELMGEEGFSSDSTLMYHKYIPSAIRDVQPWELPDQTLVPNDPMLPRHYKTQDLPASGVGVDPVNGRRLLLGNNDVRISYVVAKDPSPYYRNAMGDELLFVHSGTAVAETVFGDLEIHDGDYLIMPRATTHRIVPTGDAPLRIYAMETNSHVMPARNYLSRHGQLLEHAPFCERDFRTPTDPYIVEERDVPVHIKHWKAGAPGGIGGTVHVQPHHPFDVVGWDGCLWPYVMNISDYEPLTGRVHQPPPTHQIFESHNVVYCNFVPRKVDYHPLAIPVPYYHSNVDSDEVMFYSAGNYEARKGSGIEVGSISLHPMGHAHGPQPGAFESSIGVEYFNETAVMVDTFAPLLIGEGALAVEAPEYRSSWNVD